ncbi:MAG: hypothetical protein M3Q95_03235 [Bacteroidota bacterium]|nr:hypothetical protein [Bacteroidota bacterium]
MGVTSVEECQFLNISGDKTEKCQGGYDYWVVKLTENFNLIEGKAFADLNSNNLQDTGEPALKGITLAESYTGSLGFANQKGNFDVVVMDSGNFTVAPLLLLHYSIVPASHNAYFPSMQLTDSLNDFAFQPTGVINDLAINITPTSPFRPGFNAHYNLHYRNIGTTSLTDTIIFYPDPQITFVSSSVTPSIIAADSIMWQTSLLNPFDAGDILVTVNVNQGTPIGTLVNSSAKIEPVPGDATPVNNYAWWEVFVTGSFDPNDILVNRAAITTTELLSPPYIEYIIRFQNTGTDTAFNAKLLNPLDTAKLQLNTFELMSASHPVNITWKAWERNMEFQFNNILLPDSNINEPMSHGFVRYRIKQNQRLPQVIQLEITLSFILTLTIL